MAKVEAEARDKLTGLLLEYFRQIRQKGGYLHDTNQLIAFLQEGIEGRFWSGLFDDVVRRHGITRKQLYEIICMNGSAFLEAVNKIVLNQTATIGRLTAKAGRKARNVVRLVIPTALLRPSWATGEPLEDSEKKFAGREVTLRLVEFLKSGETYVSGETMLSRAKEQGPLAGSRACDYLYDHPKRIPEEWNQFVLVFPSTVWPDGGGRRGVRCLDCYSGLWGRCAYWLGSGFRSDDRVVAFEQVV